MALGLLGAKWSRRWRTYELPRRPLSQRLRSSSPSASFLIICTEKAFSTPCPPLFNGQLWRNISHYGWVSFLGARHFNVVSDDQVLVAIAGRILVSTLSESLVLEKLVEGKSRVVPLMSVPSNQIELYSTRQLPRCFAFPSKVKP